MSRIARPPFHLRRFIALCLLPVCAALPLQAWAVDTDGDGVDDSIDAFPANAEATVDADGDGKPDSINIDALPLVMSSDGSSTDGFLGNIGIGGWVVTAGTGRTGSSFTAGSDNNEKNFRYTVTLPPQGGVVRYWHKRAMTSQFTPEYSFARIAGSLFTDTSWVQSTYPLPGGSVWLVWYAKCGYLSQPRTCGYLDDIEVRAGSLLTEDQDDDNDGIPDSFDPAPLDPNSVAPLDGNYKGSVIREAVSP